MQGSGLGLRLGENQGLKDVCRQAGAASLLHSLVPSIFKPLVC